MTTERAARILKVSAKTVRRYIARGHLDAVKLERVWRICPTSIDHLLVAGTQAPPQKGVR